MDHGENGRKKLVAGPNQVQSRGSEYGTVDRSEDGTDNEERHNPGNGLLLKGKGGGGGEAKGEGSKI